MRNRSTLAMFMLVIALAGCEYQSDEAFREEIRAIYNPPNGVPQPAATAVEQQIRREEEQAREELEEENAGLREAKASLEVQMKELEQQVNEHAARLASMEEKHQNLRTLVEKVANTLCDVGTALVKLRDVVEALAGTVSMAQVEAATAVTVTTHKVCEYQADVILAGVVSLAVRHTDPLIGEADVTFVGRVCDDMKVGDEIESTIGGRTLRLTLTRVVEGHPDNYCLFTLVEGAMGLREGTFELPFRRADFELLDDLNSGDQAKGMYNGKVIEVTGIIERRGFSSVTFKPDTRGRYAEIECRFNDTHLRRIESQLCPGTKVRIKGRCDLFSDDEVQLANCEIVNE